MFIFLKIIHMGALMGGAAAMVGNGILMARLMRAKAPPPDIVQDTMRILGMTGAISIALLWLSGLGMIWTMSGIPGPAWAFWIKLVGATIVLVTVAMMTRAAASAQKAGTPPDMARMHRLAQGARFGITLAVIFAVIAFN